ncbi:MAG: undecaprenyl diphosphate synthase [Candidatus Atribacteria bacterium]|nr:undecaprenyl diphosphate synthase [Candidatus Atribacteria bacterium]
MGKERKGDYERLNSLITHIAIIMDGNGRWASRQGLPRLEGHKKGTEVIETIVEECHQRGVSFLTLYSFSTENWKRPLNEVEGLMQLFSQSLDKYGPKLKERQFRIKFLGKKEGLPSALVEKMIYWEKAVPEPIFTLNLAINYGGRDEIVRAYQKILEKKLTASSLDENNFRNFLDTKTEPDPDLLIRTGGEKRLSNFLLWQTAYSELWFTDILWPDFGKEELDQAIEDFSRRKRKFGGID